MQTKKKSYRTAHRQTDIQADSYLNNNPPPPPPPPKWGGVIKNSTFDDQQAIWQANEKNIQLSIWQANKRNIGAILLAFPWQFEIIKDFRIVNTAQGLSSINSYMILTFNPLQDDKILVLSELNSSPNNKIVNWSKLKAAADNKLNVITMTISLFDWVENTVGEGENAGYQRFLLFLQCFSNPSSLGWLSQDYVVKSVVKKCRWQFQGSSMVLLFSDTVKKNVG